MSSEKPNEKAVHYVSDLDSDFIFVYLEDWDDENPQIPIVIVPTSPRARHLFGDWGWEEGSTGISPPADAMNLLQLLPINWACETQQIKEGKHVIQEITLPTARLMLH